MKPKSKCPDATQVHESKRLSMNLKSKTNSSYNSEKNSLKNTRDSPIADHLLATARIKRIGKPAEVSSPTLRQSSARLVRQKASTKLLKNSTLGTEEVAQQKPKVHYIYYC